MSLRSLYNTKKDAFAPPTGYASNTYTKKVAEMNSKGTLGNDLVQKDLIDPTFRPPSTFSPYLETIFQQGLNKNI